MSPSQPSPNAPPGPGPAARKSLEGAQVLVVDDEPGIRQMLEILFRRQGAAVEVAPGYAASLAKLRAARRPFDVVVTDLSMPDGSGLDVLVEARSVCATTEVILLTAYSTLENAISAMRRGAYDFVTKPFEPAELSALVAKALEKRALAEENMVLSR